MCVFSSGLKFCGDRHAYSLYVNLEKKKKAKSQQYYVFKASRTTLIFIGNVSTVKITLISKTHADRLRASFH